MITEKDLNIKTKKLWINSKGKQVSKKPNICLGLWVFVETSYDEIFYSECDLLANIFLGDSGIITSLENKLIQRILDKINKRGK